MTVRITRKMKEIVLLGFLLFAQHHTLLQAAPPIESCPHDSIQVADTCKCNYELCSKPPCLYELNISVNGTDVPGSCCTMYTCDGCANDTLIEGKCPCAPGATLNSRGECKCVNPHESLVGGECVCDPDRCELPQICDKNSVSVSDKDGCCTKTKCIKCPDDSFATNNNDDAIEDKCVCYPCTKECGPDERVVIMQRGSGFPGSCCDMYKCEKGDVEKKCVVEDIVYGEGESWETADAQTCKCQGGISFCSKPTEEEVFRSCHKEGSVYKHSESWMVDSCTNCTCDNGETKCIAHMCELSQGQLKKPECQPLNCSKVCPDGYKQNKRGCKICKCNYPYKYDDILHKYNITKNKLKDILEDYFAHSKAETTTTVATVISTTIGPVTNISDKHQFTTPVSGTDHLLWIKIVCSIVGVVVIVILIFLLRKCRSHGKKGSYDTNPATSTIYERVKLTKDTFFNNNYIGNNNKDNKNIKGSV